eukprot:CAMPEP_0185577518 /NCGR_PEP_ID=MMETSP0434-20130131/10397_1 /TAXON_ID=626734 ORGANISM="Favella taraikaensis, Strain Fe Narragansett Bay" /NCGR_SAMPLE_ID=MMETSP0434 /ASSEMBLY_ACC=CAM_ASM_000379 /LENGTH=91 /DNA_ID=CAMNT_0028195113 /DNA_START=58 /DNA_END=333 /DNA_ORIENTATION=-
MPALSVRAFNTTIQDKKSVEEKSYFSKQDAKLLKKLVEKMEARDEMPTEATQEHSATCDDLAQIFERNQLSKDGKDSLLWQELMEWRRTKY